MPVLPFTCFFSYLGLVFYMGLIPLQIPAELGFKFQDKLLHTFVFGGMQVSHFWLFTSLFKSVSLVRANVYAALSATFFGALLEFLQGFMPFRSAEGLDLAADTFGALMAGTLTVLTIRVMKGRSHAQKKS